MKHNPIDLKAEVRRAVLPDGLNGFLFPLYEAVSNALHSIEDRWADELEEKGALEIVFDFNAQSVKVSDNGNGFDEQNLTAFLTPLTGNKFERGGKGFGRFMAFKVYRDVCYSSKQKVKDDEKAEYSCRYDPFSQAENLIDIEPTSGAGTHPYGRGITVMMHTPLDEFESYFHLDSQETCDDGAVEDIVSAILDHFLIEFIQKKIPKNSSISIQGAKFNLYDYFRDSLSTGGSRTTILQIGEESFEFKFDFFKVGTDQAKKHRLYFYADNRAASLLENISSGLNNKPFTEQAGEKTRRYYYLVAVSSSFFRSSQSRDRITNLHGKISHNGSKLKSIKDHLIALAKLHVLEIEPEYTTERRKKMQGQVDHLITVDPLLRRGLGGNSSEEFVEKRSITETREQLAQDLFVERFRTKFDFTKLDDSCTIDELVDVVRTKIPADAKEALAVYVAYRNHVIQIFRELLKKTDEGLATEANVHQLIYPRYKDSEEIDYSSHNLWLIDDDLAYARYISSDRTPKGKGRSAGEFAHDILINNEEELMVVEMKRPQKMGYSTSDEGSTNNPVDQLKKQISDIRKRGEIVTSGNRKIAIQKTSMVRGYVLADWNDNLETYLANEDFTITNFGGPMAYRYFGKLNLMLEVLAFDRLIDRASNRNEAFVSMLEGRSNYDRKAKGALSDLMPSINADQPKTR